MARQLDITLERNSPVPLYYQLAQHIEHAIIAATSRRGIGSRTSCRSPAASGLSRPTARQAIQELVNKGLLVRKRGVGTQVVRSQFRRDEKLSSLNEDLAKAGKIPSTVLLNYSIGQLDLTRSATWSTPPTCSSPSSSRSAGCGWPTTCRWPS